LKPMYIFRPLPKPKLLAYTVEVAEMVGLSESACATDQFTAFFSGNVSAIPQFRSWCTGYALSIYGTEMTDNCPFKTGF